MALRMSVNSYGNQYWRLLKEEKAACSTPRVPGQPEIRRKILSQKEGGGKEGRRGRRGEEKTM